MTEDPGGIPTRLHPDGEPTEVSGDYSKALREIGAIYADPLAGTLVKTMSEAGGPGRQRTRKVVRAIRRETTKATKDKRVVEVSVLRGLLAMHRQLAGQAQKDDDQVGAILNMGGAVALTKLIAFARDEGK